MKLRYQIIIYLACNMHNRCCVVSCDSRRKNVNLYCFPKNEEHLEMWLKCIDCDVLRSLTVKELRKRFVCQKHFEKRFLVDTPVRSRLRVGAYPTLFSDNKIRSFIPKNPTAHHISPVVFDHNYTKKRQHNDHNYGATEKQKIIFDTDQSCPSTSTGLQNMVPYTSPCTVSTEADREYIKSQKQLEYLKQDRTACKFLNETVFGNITEKMNPLAKKLIWMQIKQCMEESKGPRFTDEEKVIALAILKQSPECYKFLQKIFILPSECSLNKMIAELNIGNEIICKE